MKAVWLVRLRELASRMRFWTAIVGYDPRDRSLSQGIYLIYLVVFFCLWGFAVLALLADLGAGVLNLFKGIPPSIASTMILAVVLLIDATVQGYRSGKSSPFIFSEADAELICQTPVDRRQVALAWYLGDRLPGGLVFAALAVVLRFASLQLAEKGAIVWAHLPGYLLAGVQVVSVILPLHMAFMATDYAFGALRLREDEDNPWLRWIPVGAAAVLIGLGWISRGALQIFLWPVLFPLEAGFGEAYWLAGFVLAVTLAIAGLLVLYRTSPRLNLSRAAQESRFTSASQQVSWLGDSRLRHEMQIRRRLGPGHQVSRIVGRAGSSALIWKDWVATLRVLNFGTVIGWLGIFGGFLGIMLAPDWGVRLWAFIIWSLLIGQRCTERLRADLGVWAITRQLPFPGKKMLLAEVATPVIGAMLINCLAIGVSFGLGFSPQVSLILLAPVGTICITLAAALDILRHCRSSDLLAGQVAELGAGGLVIGIILAGVHLVMVAWITSQFNAPGILWLASFLGLVLGAGIAYAIWRLTASIYQNIK